MLTDVDEHLDQLDEQIDKFTDDDCLQSAIRVAQEMKRVAKAEQRVMPYLAASFRLMVDGSKMLQPQMARDAALEMISILESEDRAREIQPDLPLEDYEDRVWHSLTCAYDNLAENTAAINGYNSEGMHQCIADGLEVCRRSGRSACVSCFRAYAIDVYTAADDLDMAIHFSHAAVKREKDSGRDLRLNGAYNLVHLYTLKGELEKALQAGDLVKQFAHEQDPESTDGAVYAKLKQLEILTGQPVTEGLSKPKPLPDGENLTVEWLQDQTTALQETIDGNADAAIERLAKWDREFLQHECLNLFFANRLHLLAILRFAGRDDMIPRLASELDRFATQSSDWLTLRLSQLIASADAPHTPWPTLAAFDFGPFADASATKDAMATNGEQPNPTPTNETEASSDQNASAASDEGTEKDDPFPTPFVRDCAEMIQNIYSSEDVESREALTKQVREKLLAYRDVCDTNSEINWLLHFMQLALAEDMSANEVWDWAQQISKKQNDDASCVSLLANLGSTIKYGFPESKLPLEDKELERLFRRSLTLESDNSKVFLRAGRYFAFHNLTGDAERCFARAFRLDRTDSDAALSLADIYHKSDRENDSLAVLDMCLREGTENRDVLWEAATTAFRLQKFGSVVTYLDKYDSLAPGNPWSDYYRASSMLEMGHYEEAQAVLQKAEALKAHLSLAWKIQSASTAGGVGDVDTYRVRATEVLAEKLSSVETLNAVGLAALFERLWTESKIVPNDDPIRLQIEQRLLESGLAPDDYFDVERSLSDSETGLNYYRCMVNQPLDDKWADFAGCLSDQKQWTAYQTAWGVFARSKEHASELVLAVQRKCFHLEPAITEVEMLNDDFEDQPGILWQGYRYDADESSQ